MAGLAGVGAGAGAGASTGTGISILGATRVVSGFAVSCPPLVIRENTFIICKLIELGLIQA